MASDDSCYLEKWPYLFSNVRYRDPGYDQRSRVIWSCSDSGWRNLIK